MKYLILCLFLVGCSKYSGPYRACLKNESYSYLAYNPALKMTTTQTAVRCVKYSVQEYIKIDKTVYEVQKVYEEK